MSINVKYDQVLWIESDTYLKQFPFQSTDPGVGQLVVIPKGSKRALNWVQDAQEHVLVSLKEPVEGKHNWHVFKGHIRVTGNTPENEPSDKPDSGSKTRAESTENSPEKKKYTGKSFKVPTRQGTLLVRTDEPLYKGCRFTWGEATKGGTRIPINAAITEGIIRLGRELTYLRDHLGVPLVVNSWYRDPDTNRKVGGARNSYHLTGLAADITLVGGKDVRTIWSKVLKFWGKRGGVAHAFGSKGNFIHLDLRGYFATWAY